MKRVLFFLLFFIISFFSISQSFQRPKLVVGIVIDQMRWDYLYRYYDRFTNNGFKRLLHQGFSCENAFIPYTPTYTGPGHSCIYTGSVPSLHGIIANNWYDKELNKIVYCTEDNTVATVGSNSAAGKMSPANLWSTTFCDELRLATNFRSKTISIAIKDRGAILPGGHTANAAYWFDNASGGWISSSYYMHELPSWVKKLNDKKLPDVYLKQNWNTLYPAETYKQSTPDDEAYENSAFGSNIFPHRTDTIIRNKYEFFRSTPFGNTYTFDMAETAVESEGLGKNAETDILALSFSSTDYVGHAFGPNSVEVEDIYLRFDKDLAAFLNFLDQTVGEGKYLLFLTADHGVAHIPAYALEHKIPSGTIDDVQLKKELNDELGKIYAVPSIISQVMNYQAYLNDNLMNQNKLDRASVKNSLIRILLRYPGIAKAFDLANLQGVGLPQQVKNAFINGYNQKLSGDVEFIFKPQWFEGSEKGTTHGLWNPYDAHIPMLWFGWNIKAGKTNREVYMTDIAPTVSALLHIQMPNTSIGKPIEELMDNSALK